MAIVLIRGCPRKKPHLWERKYQQKGTDFPWYIPEPPAELVRNIQTGQNPHGPALDLGCGPGTATSYLASHFNPTIGLDISETAVRLGKKLAMGKQQIPNFFVADAVRLPFHNEKIAFIFDRGCLHNLQRTLWRTYFNEVERVLKPGGIFHLLCLSTKNLPSILSPAWAYAWIKRYIIKNKAFISRPLIDRLRHASMAVLLVEDTQFQLKNGKNVFLINGLFKKNEKK